MQLIDSHCHLADQRLGPDIEGVIERSRTAGVVQWVVPTAHADEWAELADLASHFDGLHAAYGIHPWYCERHTDSDMETLRQRLSGAVALGECGLDFGPGRADEATQLRWLRNQLELAEELHLPVILHAFKSLDQLTRELKNFSSLHGLVHGFTGNRRQAEKLVELRFHLGIGTRITRPEASRLRDTVQGLPLEYLCIETDAPDQPPPGWAGEHNEPAALPSVLAALAQIRNIAPDELAARCNANARELFRL